MQTRRTIPSHVALSLLAGLALSATIAQAQPIAAEGFGYEPGTPILGQTGGTGWAGAWQSAGYGEWKSDAVGTAYAKDGLVLSASGKRATSSSGGLQRQIAGPAVGVPGTTLWVSFIAQQTQGAAEGSWLGLKLPCTGPNPFLFLGKSYDKAQWGADAGLSGTTRESSSPASTRALIVARIDFREGADDVAVWINPQPSEAYLLTVSPDLALAQYGDFSGISKAVIETGSLAGPVRGFVDELRLGHAAGDVMPVLPGIASAGARLIPQGQAQAQRLPDGSVLLSNLGAAPQDNVRFALDGLEGHGYSMDLEGFLTTPGAVIRETCTDSAGATTLQATFTSAGDSNFHLDAVLPGGAGTWTVGGTDGRIHEISYLPQTLYLPTDCGPYMRKVLRVEWSSWIEPAHWGPCNHNPHDGGCWYPERSHPYMAIISEECESFWINERADIGPVAWMRFSGDTDGIPHDDDVFYSSFETQGLSQLTLSGMSGQTLGQRFHALGDALIAGGPEISLDNFGPQSQDSGIAFDLDQPMVGHITFQAPDLRTEPGTVAIISSSAASGQMTETSRLEYRHENGRMSVVPDYSIIGTQDVLVTIRDQAGTIIEQAMVPAGSGVTIADGPGDPGNSCSSSQRPIYTYTIIGYTTRLVGGPPQYNVYWLEKIPIYEARFAGCEQCELFGYFSGGSFHEQLLCPGAQMSVTFEPEGSDVGPDGNPPPTLMAVTGSDLSGPLVITDLSLQALPPHCPADFDADGTVDFFDYDAFVVAFESGAPGADFDADGTIDFFDYDAFVNAFEIGC